MGSDLLELPFFKASRKRTTTKKRSVLIKRVVVTGVGVVSPIGIGKEAFWRALIAGKCGIGPVTHFDASSYPCKIAAEVNDFEATNFLTPKSARRISRGTQFAIVSTQKAFEDSGLNLPDEDPYRVGLSYGTALGPMDIYEKFGSAFYERGLRRVIRRGSRGVPCPIGAARDRRQNTAAKRAA